MSRKFRDFLILLVVLLSACTSPGATPLPPPPTPETSPLPPPTWGAMPTRLPTPTPPSPVADKVLEVRLALLRGNVTKARRLWNAVRELAPDSAAVWREGVRLALAQDDLAAAEERAWLAVELGAKDAESWSLLGLVLLQLNQDEAAAQALGVAEALAPELSGDIFLERWRSARRSGDTNLIADLAQQYSFTHPDDPLAYYYRAAALIAARDARSAIDLLVRWLREASDADAVYWYTLGRAYAARGAWRREPLPGQRHAPRGSTGSAGAGLPEERPLRGSRGAPAPGEHAAPRGRPADPRGGALPDPHAYLDPMAAQRTGHAHACTVRKPGPARGPRFEETLRSSATPILMTSLPAYFAASRAAKTRRY